MMSGPRLVNKQFNSPIKMYSPQAIQETLEKQTQVLSNGAIGIDFKQLAKPTNLQNSAVLRMLEEEEERKRAGKAGLKRVAWPPPPEEQDVDYVEQGPVQEKTRSAGEHATYQSQKSQQASGRQQPQSPQPSQSKLQPLSPQPNIHQQQQQQQQQLQQQPQYQSQSQPVTFGLRTPSTFQSQNPTPKAWAPVSIPTPTSPHHSPLQTIPESLKTWNDDNLYRPLTPPISKQPVERIIPIQKEVNQQPFTSPTLPPIKTWNDKPSQPEVRPQQVSAISKQPVEHIIPIQVSTGTRNDQHQGQSPQRHSQSPSTVPSTYEQPPSTITLRPELPISQESSPVFQAQPAATNPNSGSMRGDLKWPPQSVRDQTEAENRARIELAKGPVCRPRRVQKDYTGFFAQHALGNNYPGYRAPPGTQFFTPAYQH